MWVELNMPRSSGALALHIFPFMNFLHAEPKSLALLYFVSSRMLNEGKVIYGRMGCILYRNCRCVLCDSLGPGVGLQPSAGREATMTWAYILSGVLAGLLMIYLVAALLKPEKF